MTLVLDLPKRLEENLVTEAARTGVPIETYVLQLLSAREHVPTTGAALVEYWRREGLIGTRLEIADSSQRARVIRENAERRERT